MRRKQASIAVFLALIFVVCSGFGSCSGTQIHKAVVASRDFRLGLTALQDGEIAWHDSGKVDNETHVAIQGYIVDAANITKEVNSQLAAGNATSALAAVQRLLTSTDSLLNLGTLHIKDKNTLAIFELSIQGIKTVITNVENYLEGAKANG